MVRPMMTFLRILIYSVVFVSRNGERKFQLEKKRLLFLWKWTCEIIIIYRDIKKKKRERERGKEGELVEYSI